MDQLLPSVHSQVRQAGNACPALPRPLVLQSQNWELRELLGPSCSGDSPVRVPGLQSHPGQRLLLSTGREARGFRQEVGGLPARGTEAPRWLK